MQEDPCSAGDLPADTGVGAGRCRKIRRRITTRCFALLAGVREVVGAIGAGVVAVSAAYYLIDVLRGGSRPQRTSWGVWALVGVLGFATSDAGGAGPGAWSSAVDAGATAITFVVSLHPRFGKPGGRRSDAALFAAACAGVVLWRSDVLGVGGAAVCAVAIDAVALWPTLREAWTQPQLESRLSWTADCGGHVLCLAAIAHTGLAAMAFPVYMIAATGAVATVLLTRQGRPSPSTFQSVEAVDADTIIATTETDRSAPAQRRIFRGHVSSDIGVGLKDLRPLTGTRELSRGRPRPSPPQA